MAVVKSWLNGEDEVVMEVYRWIGHSRRRLHKNAVRGSGGVGVLEKEDLLKHCTVQVLDVSVEDILWLQFRWGRRSRYLSYIAVCYIPSELSSRAAGSVDTLQALAEEVEKCNSMGPLVICGDFNVICAWEC